MPVPNIRRWFLPALCALLFTTTPLRTYGVGFQPVSPDELKMTSEPQVPGAPAIILYRQVDRDDNGRTSHQDDYFRIKILTEEGRKYADIEIPYFKDSENIVGIKARSIRPDGTITNFDGKVFDKTIAKAKGLKYLAKTLTLSDVQVGSIIEYYYTHDLNENFIFDSHWILSQDHFVRLETQNIPAFQTEDFMPPENEVKSRVDFIYSEEDYGPDVDKYWKKAGKKLNEQMESFIGKRKAEQAVVTIVSPGDSQEQKARKTYARVQQIRNTSFEVHKTEQEQKRSKEKDVTECGRYVEAWVRRWIPSDVVVSGSHPGGGPRKLWSVGFRSQQLLL